MKPEPHERVIGIFKLLSWCLRNERISGVNPGQLRSDCRLPLTGKPQRPILK